MTNAVDEQLSDWASLSGASWPTLLIGNGFSINLWDGFRYDSLLKEARLKRSARTIFNELSTSNFETVLESLQHARLVLTALDKGTTKVDRTYERVRDSLFDTLNKSHVPWGKFPVSTHTQIALAMARHKRVFTTNYDLTLYWSQLESTNPVSVKDYFWQSNHTFDPADTSSTATLVHYLHGGLHLWSDDNTGVDGKWTSATGSLLDLKSKYGLGSHRRPLFVSEGSWQAKVRTIRRSAYLSFCLDELREDDENTVIIGHGLSDQDAHVIQALNAGRRRKVAVSLYPGGKPKHIVAEKGRIQKALAKHRVVFFNSSTHPLGDPAFHIT